MSLLNQLIAAVFAVLIGLVSGTLYIMSDSSRSMLLNQLESHSQDTATHLGLYLAPFMANDDVATIETTVNAIFDSGFYQSIVVTKADGTELFKASAPLRVADNVPNWFVSLIEIPAPVMNREVSFQWQKAGNITVQSRTGYAYEQLWKGIENTLIWFISLSLLAVFTLSYVLRLILHPLKGVEQQATALAERRYIEQPKLPRTREFHQVVSAMNRMVRRVQRMFDEQNRHIDELRKTAYEDNLTGLANQRATLAQMSDWLEHRQELGTSSCIYLHLHNLQQLNEALGEEETNNILRKISEQLAQLSRRYSPAVLGRVSGADFAMLLPESDPARLKQELSLFTETLQALKQHYQSQHQQTLFMPIAVVHSEPEATAESLLADARTLISGAIDTQQDVVYPDSFNAPHSSSSEWQAYVADAISGQRISIQYQALVGADGTTPLQQEWLARILKADGSPATAAEFIHVVKSLALTERLDKAVIAKAAQYLSSQQQSTPVTINLSQQTIHSHDFMPWLTAALAKAPAKGRLNIEINETAALNDIGHVALFRSQLKQAGIQFGIDNFGIHPSGFSYLYTVQPDYIKIDGALCRNVESSPEDRFFISSLITAAHSLGIKVYAERIERPEQVEQLTQLNIDGVQGYLFGQPKAL